MAFRNPILKRSSFPRGPLSIAYGLINECRFAAIFVKHPADKLLVPNGMQIERTKTPLRFPEKRHQYVMPTPVVIVSGVQRLMDIRHQVDDILQGFILLAIRRILIF